MKSDDVTHSPFCSPTDGRDTLSEIERLNRLDANLAEPKRRLAALARDVRLFEKHCRELCIPNLQDANGELIGALERIHNLLAR